MPSMIGLIMLMGIATKNSILLVEDAIMARRDRGMTRLDPLMDACHKRARPIVMTTLAMGAGMTPIALGLGTDPSFRAPMATVVIGGLITSTFLSLLVIPVVFTFVDDAVQKIKGLFRHHDHSTSSGGPNAVGTAAVPRSRRRRSGCAPPRFGRTRGAAALARAGRVSEDAGDELRLAGHADLLERELQVNARAAVSHAHRGGGLVQAAALGQELGQPGLRTGASVQLADRIGRHRGLAAVRRRSQQHQRRRRQVAAHRADDRHGMQAQVGAARQRHDHRRRRQDFGAGRRQRGRRARAQVALGDGIGGAEDALPYVSPQDADSSASIAAFA